MTFLIDVHTHGVIALGHGFSHVTHLAQRCGDTSRKEIGNAQRHYQSQWHGNPTGPSELQEKPAHREGDGGGANDKRTELQLERREQINRLDTLGSVVEPGFR